MVHNVVFDCLDLDKWRRLTPDILICLMLSSSTLILLLPRPLLTFIFLLKQLASELVNLTLLSLHLRISLPQFLIDFDQPRILLTKAHFSTNSDAFALPYFILSILYFLLGLQCGIGQSLVLGDQLLILLH